MAVRMTGMISGLDTESMVKEMVSAASTKVDDKKKEKQLAEWKKEAWSSLNTKIYSFYKTELGTVKQNASFMSKIASANDDTKATITANSKAADGIHTLSIKQVASSAYLTGANIKESNSDVDVKKTTKLTDLGIQSGTSFSIKGQDFVVTDDTTLDDLATGFSKMGVSASFDETQGRFYINASGTGSENDFNVTSSDDSALEALGLSTGATKIDAKDAIIDYNGVEYRNATNTFSINNLTITAKAVTGEYNAETGEFKNDSQLSVTVKNDTDGMYEKIKKFVNAYNTLIDEMNDLYDEETTDYEPLTDDEKSELSDTQIEQWEKKAKQGILRRDSTINTLLSNMRTTLNKGIEIDNGDGTTTRYSLASLGIVTGDYSENGKLHIQGDEDDSTYADEDNKLKAMLESNSDVVAKVFAGSTDNPGVGLQMYNSLTKSMKRIEGVRSSQTFYNDKTLDDEIDDYDDEIDDLEDKLNDLEDKYYDQFSAMETAMAKLQTQQSYLSSLG